jgi:hypothetical protein
VGQNRLIALNNICRRSHNASQYVKNEMHDHPFHGHVYPSIMLEVSLTKYFCNSSKVLFFQINVTDPRASKYFSALISRRDKIALLCERREDFNDLFITLKQKFGKGLNMLVQGNDVPTACPTDNEMQKMKFVFVMLYLTLYNNP